MRDAVLFSQNFGHLRNPRIRVKTGERFDLIGRRR
jgi:hypothetical protein